MSSEGDLIPLPEQDRARWDQDLIREGHALVRGCLVAGEPGPYQVQAAIQAVHCDAESDADTDWRQILALYDGLLSMQPTDAVRTARVVAVSHVYGPGRALRESGDAPDRYGLAVRADLLQRLGRADEARTLFLRAAELATNAAESRLLRRRAREVGGVSRGRDEGEGAP